MTDEQLTPEELEAQAQAEAAAQAQAEADASPDGTPDVTDAGPDEFPEELVDVAASERESVRLAEAEARVGAIEDGQLKRSILHRGKHFEMGTPVEELGKLTDDETARLDRLGAF